jgi:hypothetical protein
MRRNCPGADDGKAWRGNRSVREDASVRTAGFPCPGRNLSRRSDGGEGDKFASRDLAIWQARVIGAHDAATHDANTGRQAPLLQTPNKSSSLRRITPGSTSIPVQCLTPITP